MIGRAWLGERGFRPARTLMPRRRPTPMKLELVLPSGFFLGEDERGDRRQGAAMLPLIGMKGGGVDAAMHSAMAVVALVHASGMGTRRARGVCNRGGDGRQAGGRGLELTTMLCMAATWNDLPEMIDRREKAMAWVSGEKKMSKTLGSGSVAITGV